MGLNELSVAQGVPNMCQKLTLINMCIGKLLRCHCSSCSGCIIAGAPPNMQIGIYKGRVCDAMCILMITMLQIVYMPQVMLQRTQICNNLLTSGNEAVSD